jgi:hypothetical protein
MKRFALTVTLFLALAGFLAPARAALITLDTGLGGSDQATIADVALGNAVQFEYSFASVTFGGGPWVGLNASVIPPLGGFPVGQFNDYHNGVTGWLTGSIDTSIGSGLVRSLVFTANTFGATGNSAVIQIRSVTIDGREILAVDEPGVLLLLASGLGLMAWSSGRLRIGRR